MDPAVVEPVSQAALAPSLPESAAPAPARFRSLPLPVASLAAVPEPAGLVLLGLGALLLIRRRRSL
ncbi:MAG: PEP-CTERM sorting domain-containing protein [Pseudomonadota bacterium]